MAFTQCSHAVAAAVFRYTEFGSGRYMALLSLQTGLWLLILSYLRRGGRDYRRDVAKKQGKSGIARSKSGRGKPKAHLQSTPVLHVSVLSKGRQVD